jgi:uncharacterized protein YndB with AHSA1/START domain
MTLAGTFREIAAPERIVHDEVWEEPWFDGDCLVTTGFAEDGSGTLMSMRIRYASAAARAAVLKTPMAEGMEEGYSRLNRLLAPAA